MSATDGPVLWLCGVTGVGKSTVGYAVYRRAVSAGLMAAYVDLDQIGFSGRGTFTLYRCTPTVIS